MIIILLSTDILFSEAIYMNDGRIIYGKIHYQDKDRIDVKTRYGKMKLKKRDIKKIDYDQGLGAVTVVMKNNENISGILVSITTKQVVVREDNQSKTEHVVQRKNIESLFLRKFAGRRDNLLALSWGINKSIGRFGKSVKMGFINFNLAFSRPLGYYPGFFWGLSLSFLRLNEKMNGSPLGNATMTINPALVNVEYRYALFGLLINQDWAYNLLFSLHLGAGVSFVTLGEEGKDTTASYFTTQPGIGIDYKLNDRLQIIYDFHFLYIYQKDLPYQSIRNELGIGILF
jgi:hypothetical protein